MEKEETTGGLLVLSIKWIPSDFDIGDLVTQRNNDAWLYQALQQPTLFFWYRWN